MKRSVLGRIARTLALLCLCLPTQGGVSAAETLAEIRDAYVQQVHALQSVAVDYRVRQTLDESVLGDARSGPGDLMHKHWIRDGKRWVRRMEPFLFPGSQRAVAQYLSFDGENAWQVSYTGDRATEIQEIAKCCGFLPWSQPALIELERLLGTNLNDSAHSLENLFDRPNTQLAGVESVEGVECAKVDFGTVPISDGAKSLTVEAWFDPTSRYLPRKIEWLTAIVKPEAVARGANLFQETLTVSKFQDVFDPELQQHRSYPSIGSIVTPYSLQEIIVDQVQLHPALESSAFRPALADGVLLLERYKDGSSRKSIVGGGKIGAGGQSSGLGRAAPSSSVVEPKLAPVGQPIDASVPTGSRGVWIAAALGVIALCAAIFMRFARRAA